MDVNTNDGLLILVDQIHQLLRVISFHQHNGTGERVGLPQLRVVDGVPKNKKRTTHKRECDIPVTSALAILLLSPRQQHRHHR